MTLSVDITDGRGLSNEACHELLTVKEGNAVFICRSLYGKRHLTSCILLTRRSTSILKVGVPCRL